MKAVQTTRCDSEQHRALARSRHPRRRETAFDRPKARTGAAEERVRGG